MAGKTTLVYISDDGTSLGTMNAVENQGDLRINLGKPISREAYKNGAVAAQGEDGLSGSFNFSMQRPAGTAQADLLAAHDAGGDAYLEIKDSVTGGQKWVGDFIITITEITEPTDGEHTHACEFAQNGTVTRSVV